MDTENELFKEIINEHEERMHNIKRYYPYFVIANNSLAQFKEGKYQNVDMGFIFMSILRMFIEENNFNDTGVTYRTFFEFMVELLRRQFKLYLSEEENNELITYIFDKIKNDGKPFEFTYYEPLSQTEKVTRIRFIDSTFYNNNVCYYITSQGIEFYLDTKEIKDESKISIQQLLLEKMIASQNFSGSVEVIKRINNEVSKLKYRKNEVIERMSYDIRDGIAEYEDFLNSSIRWFDEEHLLFKKNMSLVETAMSLVEADDIAGKENIKLLEAELKRAISKHSELLSECMDLKKRADQFIEAAKNNSLKISFDFKDALDIIIAKDDASMLSVFVEPLIAVKNTKFFGLSRLDELLTCKAEEVDEGEAIKEDKEEDYICEDIIEEERINHNYIVFAKILFKLLSDKKVFCLKDYNELLQKLYGAGIFCNGDYYSFIVQMCQKKEYDVFSLLKIPTTFFEQVIVKLFSQNNMEKYSHISYRLETFIEEEIELPSGFTVTNIRFERTDC